MTHNQKIRLFNLFHVPDNAPESHEVAIIIQLQMTPEQLKDYFAELKNSMLDRIHELPMVPKLNIDDATSYLLLMASAQERFDAMLHSLGLWEY